MFRNWARDLSALVIATVLMAATPVAAQSGGQVFPPGSFARGQDATVVFTDPGLANQPVTITFNNGDPANNQTVTSTADATGKVTVTWTTPTSLTWDYVNVQGPTGSVKTRPIIAEATQ